MALILLPFMHFYSFFCPASYNVHIYVQPLFESDTILTYSVTNWTIFSNIRLGSDPGLIFSRLEDVAKPQIFFPLKCTHGLRFIWCVGLALNVT